MPAVIPPPALLLLLLFQNPPVAPIPEVQGTPVDAAVLRYIELRPGTGEPARPGQRYKVHYTGWLRDGKKFDSSVDRNQPFEFVQGRRQVIAGWEAGFEGMKTGGKRRLFIPYQFAYGEKGNAVIPPKAELIFDVELLGVSDVAEVQPAAEILEPFDEYRDKLLQLARAIPDDKYGWRPAPGTRSVGEVFAHVGLGLKLMLDLAMEPPPATELNKRIAAMPGSENETRSKDELIRLLDTNFDEARKSIQPLRAGALGADVQFFGKPTTRRGILIYLDTHLAEHLGQLIAYARTLGITPPWSESRK